MKQKLLLLLTVLALGLVGCANIGPMDSQTSIPASEPAFPKFTGSWWVIDTTGTVPAAAVKEANTTLQRLKESGTAEVVIVVVNGVHDTVTWSTRFGREIKLGDAKKNNGVVYLVRPDAVVGERFIYSIGTGLPRFTSAKVTEVVETSGALAAINNGDLAAGVVALAKGTDAVLTPMYGSEATAKQKEQDLANAAVAVLVIALIWFLIGLLLCFVDVELGFQFWLLGLRILIIALSGGKAGTGGSGSFGGRSGSR